MQCKAIILSNCTGTDVQLHLDELQNNKSLWEIFGVTSGKFEVAICERIVLWGLITEMFELVQKTDPANESLCSKVLIMLYVTASELEAICEGIDLLSLRF